MNSRDQTRPELDVLHLGLVLGHGGDALQMLELAAGLSRRRQRVRVVVPDLDTSRAIAEYGRDRDVEVERTPLVHASMAGARQNVGELLQVLRRHPTKALHVHTGDSCLPQTLLIALELHRRPRVFATLQSPYEKLTPGTLRARMWALSASRCIRKVICPSQASSRAQVQLGVPAERVLTIRNSVAVDRFSNGDPHKAFNALHLPPETPLVVFSSRIDSQKRPLDALGAFLRVAADVPKAHFVFVGQGALETNARAVADASGYASRVHFAGFQRNVEDWLAAATVWLLPTESENFSLAILEAMAAGCPIVSTFCRGNDEILVSRENCLTTSVGDVAAQADALGRLLHDPELRKQLAQGARKAARDHDAERMIDAYVRCYNDSPN